MEVITLRRSRYDRVMHTQRLTDALSKRPFQPFYVVMSRGDRFAVAHPENAKLMKSGMLVLYHDEALENDLPDRFTVCSYLHIAALQPMKRRNGRSRRSGRA